MHHCVTFNFGPAKVCSPAIFETSFSYDKDIWTVGTYYYMHFYIVVLALILMLCSDRCPALKVQMQPGSSPTGRWTLILMMTLVTDQPQFACPVEEGEVSDCDQDTATPDLVQALSEQTLSRDNEGH